MTETVCPLCLARREKDRPKSPDIDVCRPCLDGLPSMERAFVEAGAETQRMALAGEFDAIGPGAEPRSA